MGRAELLSGPARPKNKSENLKIWKNCDYWMTGQLNNQIWTSDVAYKTPKLLDEPCVSFA